MQQDTRKGGAVKKWLLVAIFGSVTALGVGTALAQVTGTTPDFATLLEQFGSLFGTGTGTTTTTGTTTGTTPTTTQPGTGGEREPTIIDNQFNTTSSGSLRARAPGTWIQNAQAVQSGETEFSMGGPGEPDGFIKTTLDTIALDVINMFTDLLSGLNFLSGLGDILPGGTPGTGGLTTIPNSTTTGAGTSTPVQ